jgi:hypothetical protein
MHPAHRYREEKSDPAEEKQGLAPKRNGNGSQAESDFAVEQISLSEEGTKRAGWMQADSEGL